MVLLSVTMFTLGVLALLDTLFNYGNMFRILFAGSLMAMSVWLFVKAKSIGDLRPTNETHSDMPMCQSGQDQTQAKPEKKPQTVGR